VSGGRRTWRRTTRRSTGPPGGPPDHPAVHRTVPADPPNWHSVYQFDELAGMTRRPARRSGPWSGPAGPGAEPHCHTTSPSCTCPYPTLSSSSVTCIFIWCCFVFACVFSDSDSYSTKDSNYRIDNEDDARAFEVKKRKLDEVEGRPQRRTRQTGKTPAEGGSSAAAG
jgi:hypothetical protein